MGEIKSSSREKKEKNKTQEKKMLHFKEQT